MERYKEKERGTRDIERRQEGRNERRREGRGKEGMKKEGRYLHLKRVSKVFKMLM